MVEGGWDRFKMIGRVFRRFWDRFWPKNHRKHIEKLWFSYLFLSGPDRTGFSGPVLFWTRTGRVFLDQFCLLVDKIFHLNDNYKSVVSQMASILILRQSNTTIILQITPKSSASCKCNEINDRTKTVTKFLVY